MIRGLLGGTVLALLAACGSSEPLGLPGFEPQPSAPAEPPPPVTPPVGTGGPFVSAHRGGSAYAPENTLLAFRNAGRLYVDDFEADAWLTADNVLVLIHDDSLDRTTNCSGPVNQHTWAELQACDAAHWFSPGQTTTRPDESLPHPLRGTGISIPRATDLFEYAARFQGRYQPTITIEIKNVTEALRAAEVLVPLIQGSGIRDRIIVQSFNPLGIARIKALDPGIRTLYLTPNVLGAHAALTVAVLGGHEFVAPNFESGDLTAGFIETAHGLGKQVVPWTANRWEDIERLDRIGVDGLITDFPGCALMMQDRLEGRPLLPAELAGYDVPACR